MSQTHDQKRLNKDNRLLSVEISKNYYFSGEKQRSTELVNVYHVSMLTDHFTWPLLPLYLVKWKT